MLTALSIDNIAVIEHAELHFEAGFNVLTGETGAGKSIIMDAINAILGERTSRDLIRTGADAARVTALFEDLSPVLEATVAELGYESEDHTLLLQRRLSADGKNSVTINGMPANLTLLRTIGGHLIEIHGQHDNQSLLNKSTHLGYLDSVAGNGALRAEYTAAYNAYRDRQAEVERLEQLDVDSDQRLELLTYQIRELETSEIEIGERESLVAQRDRIRASESVAKALDAAAASLEGREGADPASCLFEASRAVEPCLALYPELRELHDALNGYGYEIQESAAQLRRKLDSQQFDPELLEEIEARLDYLYRLSKKYGATEEAMLAYLEQAKQEADELQNRELRLSERQAERDAALLDARKKAEALSRARVQAAARFEKAVCAELRDLDMPKVVFVCARQETDLTSNGIDDVEFLISVNPGEPPKPMAKIASGGELSRIMLAIKSVLNDATDVPTLIFDEIDAGISGHAALQVGRKLRRLAQTEQILCVTHLASIAAMADHHFHVEKTVKEERTYTTVTRLEREERVKEIARILSGGSDSAAMIASAEELLTSYDG
ncbi:MAG: DNA repair protein RecN [Clostridia bacterium]|nr:DNA repair protein RecN [Clostridia bacterium]